MIVFNVENEIATLVINRPQIRNALDLQTMRDFAAAIEHAQDLNLRALIVTGAGKAFISGGDLNDLHSYNTEEEARVMVTIMDDALNALESLPCITLAALEGPARGGGCEVALACDWRVAAEDADLGFVQIRLGLTTGWGGAARLQKVVGYPRALDLLVLGRVITASEAHRLGIVTHLTPPNQALKSALHIANSLHEYDRDALYAYKKILRSNDPQSVEREVFPKLWMGEAHTEAVKSFAAKRK
jgi:enoyl-CoA hydratase